MRVIVSVDRRRIQANARGGTREPVIRIRSDAATVYAREAVIRGESRVLYRPEAPLPCGARAWVETDAEVIPVEADPAGEVVDALPPPVPEPSAMGRLIESGLLDRAIDQVAAQLAADPERPLLWRRLGDLSRQAGDLDRAAAAYERLQTLSPGDPGVERLLAVLRGAPLPRPPLVWPAPFLSIAEFLPPERLEELLEFTASRQEGFEPTPVMEDGHHVLRPEVRWCDNIWEIEPVARWFEPLVAARLPEFAARLQAPPCRYEIRDCKLTRYGDGSYFRAHIDRGPGVETRVFGFVYYFYFPPRRFTGGGLSIYDWDLETGEAASTCTTVMPEQNQLLVLSSHCWHEVLPVRCESNAWDAARFTLNGWIHRAT